MLLPLSVVWKNPRHLTFLFARPFIIGMKESQFIQVHPSTGLSDNSQEVKHRYGHAAGIQTMHYHAARSTLPAWLRKRLDAKTNYQFLPVRGSFLTSKLANEMQ